MKWVIKKILDKQTRKEQTIAYSNVLKYVVKADNQYMQNIIINEEKDNLSLLKTMRKSNCFSVNGKEIRQKIKENKKLKAKNYVNEMLQKSFFAELDNKYDYLSPFNVIWGISPLCNLKCLYCYAEEKNQISNFITEHQMFLIAKKIIEANVCMVNLGGGEPLLLGDTLIKICEQLLNAGINVSVLSNAILLNEEWTQKFRTLVDVSDGGLCLTISLDGHTEALHKQTRGEGFDDILRGINLLKKYDIPFVVECVVNKKNIKYIQEIIKFVNNLGAFELMFLNLNSAPSPEIFYNLAPSLQEQEIVMQLIIEANMDENIEMVISGLELDHCIPNKNGKIMGCRAGERFCFISAEGDVYPCTAAIYEIFKMGNLLDNDSFEDIWKNNKNNEFILSHKKETNSLEKCYGCEYSGKCSSGCRGEVYSLHKNLVEHPYRCAKEANWKENNKL